MLWMVGALVIPKDCLTIGIRGKYFVLSPRPCYLFVPYSGVRLYILPCRLYDKILSLIVFKFFEMP